MTYFGKKLKKARLDRGWSLNELGRRAEIHGRQISKYERGESMPNTDGLLRIANALGVSTDYLLRDYSDGSMAPSGPLQNEELVQLFKAVENMNSEDRAVIISLIDAYIKKRQIEGLLGN